MGAHFGFTMRLDTNKLKKNAVSVCREKNHLQRILFAKILSEALKLSTFSKDLPHQM